MYGSSVFSSFGVMLSICDTTSFTAFSFWLRLLYSKQIKTIKTIATITKTESNKNV